MRKFFFLLCLVGCGPTYAQRATTWVGHTTDSLISQWGAPTARTPINGGEVLEYHRSGVEQGGNISVPLATPGLGVPYMMVNTAPTIDHYYCKTIFTANEDRIIRFVRLEGRCSRWN